MFKQGIDELVANITKFSVSLEISGPEGKDEDLAKATKFYKVVNYQCKRYPWLVQLVSFLDVLTEAQLLLKSITIS